MDLLAAVGLRVDGSGAIRTLNQFTGSAHNAGRAGGRLESAAKRLGPALGSIASYLSIRQLIEYADTWTLIRGRIGLVTETTEETMAVQQQLFEIAQRTRNSMAATSVLYTRLALNASELGRSHQELLNVVESVNAAMLISGATGVESAQSMRQLAQALGAGRLQGDEFRTVMEAMPEVARVIAEEMGVARGELYKLSREGKISVQIIIDALLKAHDVLVERAAQMPLTIGQSFILLQNAAGRMVGILNEANSVSRYLANSLKWLATNMDKVVAAVTAAIIVFGIFKTAAIGAAAVEAIIVWTRAIRAATTAAAAFQIVGKGLLGIAGVLVAGATGFAAYKLLLKEIQEETAVWEEAQGNLNKTLGEAHTPVDEDFLKLQKKTRHEIEDMLRLAEQQFLLNQLSGRDQERMSIVMDAVNKRVEARRELTGALLQEMLDAIDAERDWLLAAEERAAATEAQNKLMEEQIRIASQFAENLQRSFGDVFFKIFNDGIEKFSDLFDGIKQIFLRMLADMLAARAMKELTAQFAGIIAGIAGTAGVASAADYIPKSGALMEAAVAGASGRGSIPVIPVELAGMAVPVERTFMNMLGGILGVAGAGFGVGSMLGGLTSNRGVGTGMGALGGAATGALIGSVVPVIGTAIGAAVGGIAGAIGGWIGSNNKHEEELRRHREVLANNNDRLQDLRHAIDGRQIGAELAQNRDLIDQLLKVPAENLAKAFDKLRSLYKLHEIAEELGIELDGSTEAYEQLQEAIRLTIIAITQFGNNLTDIQMKQEAYNKLFDVEDSPQQKINDTFSVLNQMAPELMREMGLVNLDLSTELGRKALLEGLRAIYDMIVAGDLTPELLGAFTDKNQLLDAILRVKDGLDAFNQELFKVTTDFPRAMDIIYYEQKFGRYGGMGGKDGNGPTMPGGGPWSGGSGGSGRHEQQYAFVVEGDINITNEGDETGEELLEKIEHAAYVRRTRGGRNRLT